MRYNTNRYGTHADEDIVDIPTAISVVSKRLASNLTAARQQCKSGEGGKSHEQNERYGTDHRRLKIADQLRSHIGAEYPTVILLQCRRNTACHSRPHPAGRWN